MFAVLAYNNSTASSMFFFTVFQAQAQITEGLNVRMVIQALESKLPNTYLCVGETMGELQEPYLL
ncbi:hypothetical protein PVL29_012536 [Vitis rotundifolia]|uniref:Uncharacterized protein n=1 Tax=Vitis rotundifolia TaxID=103349 RepID=A0AA39DPX0_VITRO|nr:hypothetical protein PVL29_012536 [Vitis rotundifolia]